jgi:hypothetical protein
MTWDQEFFFNHFGRQAAQNVEGQQGFDLPELAEDVVEHRKVDALGGVLLIDRCYMLVQLGRYIFELFSIIPNLVEKG